MFGYRICLLVSAAIRPFVRPIRMSMVVGTPPVKLGQLDSLPDQPGGSIPFLGKLYLAWVILTRWPFLLFSRPSVAAVRVTKVGQRFCMRIDVV